MYLLTKKKTFIYLAMFQLSSKDTRMFNKYQMRTKHGLRFTYQIDNILIVILIFFRFYGRLIFFTIIFKLRSFELVLVIASTFLRVSSIWNKFE